MFQELKLKKYNYFVKLVRLLTSYNVHPTTNFGRSHREKNHVTIKHYFRIEIIFTTIDK
jgi:hypothetical protein